MNKAKKAKMLLLGIAIVIELVAVFMIAKANAASSSPAAGAALLVIGLVVLVIGSLRKLENSKSPTD